MDSWEWGGLVQQTMGLPLSSDQSDDKQLLRLTICQALQSQYVMEHTRGIDRFLSPKLKGRGNDGNSLENELKEEKENDIDGNNKENSLTSLVDIALHESASRHLTAGFRSNFNNTNQNESKLNGEENKLNNSNNNNIQNKQNSFNIMIERLGRKLSAIGLSSDLSYLSLTNKRSIILNKIILEYQKEYRLKGMALLTRKTLPDNSHSLLKITVNSGVFFMC